MTAEALVAAIRGNDLAQLTRVPGIGRKTAERMVLELRDKLEGFGATPARTTAASPVAEDVLSALLNLGYARPLAERAVSAAAKNGGAASFDALFRNALASLSK
jgi:holliday junction DNA helicase RuvA